MSIQQQELPLKMSSDLQKTVQLLLKEYIAPTRKEGERFLLLSDIAYSRIFMGTPVSAPPPMPDVAEALRQEGLVATYSTQTQILRNGVFSKTRYLSVLLA